MQVILNYLLPPDKSKSAKVKLNIKKCIKILENKMKLNNLKQVLQFTNKMLCGWKAARIAIMIT